jgi:polyisoprenoid-binding protein YceI
VNTVLRAALGALLLALPLAARADPQTWTAVPAESELRFSAYYEGEELSGRFAAFTVTVETDCETGAPAALVVEVETASADMSDREINAEIDEPEWFDVASFPTARFEAHDIQPAEPGYLAVGRLQLKGIDQSLELPLAWEREGDSAGLTGSIRMSRQEWRIGTGEWSNDASLSDRVDLRWRVKLVPAD